jgi:hypothetical protein
MAVHHPERWRRTDLEFRIERGDLLLTREPQRRRLRKRSERFEIN